MHYMDGYNYNVIVYNYSYVFPYNYKKEPNNIIDNYQIAASLLFLHVIVIISIKMLKFMS